MSYVAGFISKHPGRVAIFHSSRGIVVLLLLLAHRLDLIIGLGKLARIRVNLRLMSFFFFGENSVIYRDPTKPSHVYFSIILQCLL
jgi:hypothetical protein